MKILTKFLTLLCLAALVAGCNLSGWLTYTNTVHQFQFQYPSGSTLVSDSPTAARIQLPIAPDTNLVEKYLDVSVEMGAIPCLSPYSTGYMPPGILTTGTQTINDIYWVIEESSEGAMGSFYQWKSYSAFNGSDCVSLTFVLHSHNIGMYEDPPDEFDLEEESEVFGLIMATFTWLEELPTCATEDLMAPALVDPPDGAEVGTLMPILHWSYLDSCAPEGYRIDLSIDPTFADTSLSGGTGNPSTSWAPGDLLTDCTTYFWRVAPINDTTLGPFSGIFTFRTNVSGACAPESPASISGSVWVDTCSVPLDTSPAPDPLPDGCALSAYGIDADGIHQEEELYVFGMPVHLGPGDCPQAGPLETTTDSQGAFSFTGLAPGKYCLNVNGADIFGLDALGHWTLVPSGHEGNSYRLILIGAGEDLVAQDFAWYLEEDVITPTPAAFSFYPSLNAYCRSGPDPIFGSRGLAMRGQSYPVDGRNLMNTWLYILLTPQVGCWVPVEAGSASGDTSLVRVLNEIATPTFTPPPATCSQYPDEKSCEAHPECIWRGVTAPTCQNR